MVGNQGCSIRETGPWQTNIFCDAALANIDGKATPAKAGAYATFTDVEFNAR